MQQFYPSRTKPPDPVRSRSAMDEQFEIELINIISSTKRSPMIASQPIYTDAMGFREFAAGAKSQLEMRRITASFMNCVEATSVTTRAVPRSSCGLINNDISATEIGAFPRSSSALPRGAGTAAAAGGLYRGAGAVKVKKKRVRPSRRVPTTVVRTDTSNFKAMVEQFTGIPTLTITPQKSTITTSASSSRESTSCSASSPSFTKPVPHYDVCKISSSAPAAPNISSPCPSSLPTCQSLPSYPS